MAEKIRTITDGRDPLYEIVENDDGVSITLREAEDHTHQVMFLRSMIPTLTRMLNELRGDK